MQRVRMDGGFWIKAVAAGVLVAGADLMIFDRWIGWTLGLFALGWTIAVVAVVPAARRGRGARIALAAAALLGLVMLDHPSRLAWTMFWVALSTAALLPRRRFDDALRWGARLLLHGLSSFSVPADLIRLRRMGARRGSGRGMLRDLGLPVAGSLLFIALFALANPLIENALTWRSPLTSWLPHIVFCGLMLLIVWPSLRPRRWATSSLDRPIALAVALPGVSVASVTLSLVLFNIIFAIANALDIVFLWSGAALPDGMAMKDYVHRGAYPLVATALIAGLFVLATTRPGSATATNAAIRWLLLLWTFQNLVLLASSAARTLVYVDLYMLTIWRIAALAWMGLVGTGLVLILWRMWAGRSAEWLINRNALAAALVLSVACVIDLGAVAAAWNVRHAGEVGGRGQALDLCYLHAQGAAALVPVARAERDAVDPAFRDRLTWLRDDLHRALAARQADRHGWTARGARRLAVTEAITGPRPPRPRPAPWGRSCMGWPHGPPDPPPAPEQASPPLTGAVAR